MTDHIIFPLQYSTGESEGKQRFDEFETLLLHNWSTMLANPTMWFVLFDGIPAGIKGMDSYNTVNKEGPNMYTQLDGNQTNLLAAIQNRKGCFLIHGIELPTIGVQANRAAPLMGGYYGGLVADTVDEQNVINMEFRETHSSYIDFIFRPWVEMVAKNGFIARPPDDPRNVKCDMTVVKLGKAGPGTDPVKRKVWRFYNCSPIMLANHRLTHDGTWSAPDMYINTTWTYSHYDIKDIRIDNIKAAYKAHVESPTIKPLPGSRTSGRVGANDGPAGEITVV